MKKFLIMLLILLLVFSAFSLVSCSGGDDSTKFGIGIYSVTEETADASGEENGRAMVSHTVAAVVISTDGRVEKCQIDVAENAVGFTSTGKAALENGFLTKGELGDAYNMKAAGAKLEWYEQRDAFVKTVEGKSLREIKALVADGGKGNGDVVSAGCTIVVSDFVKAIERAFDNAESIENAEGASLEMKISTSAEASDASGTANGKIDVVSNISATVMNGEQELASLKDSVSFSAEFDVSGKIQGK